VKDRAGLAKIVATQRYSCKKPSPREWENNTFLTGRL
jgi:hypothetical protein